MFDVCVIGAGLIGSAAAKYCANGGVKTCLIGPEEPKWQDFDKQDVFGAWFDEGRIARHLAGDPVWAILAAESIKRFRSIERESGIAFFEENGYLLICDDKGDDYPHKTLDTMNGLGCEYVLLDNEQLRKKFPYINIPEGVIGMFEQNNAGSINPRRLVEAQLKLFQNGGGVWVKEVAVKVNRDQDTFNIHTNRGTVISASKVLACPGAFIHHFPLLPSMKLDFRYRKALTSRIRMDSGPLLDTLKQSMPSFALVSKRGRRDNIFGHNNSEVIFEERVGGGLAFYGMAPRVYPDGHTYLKIGWSGGGMDPRYVDGPKSVNEWYKWRGSEQNRLVGQQMSELTKEFIPGLDISQFEVDTCINLETPTGRPYLDQVEKNFYTVVGGNGYAAKSSDELGRLGAGLAINDGKWPSELVQADDFRIRFINKP